MLLLHLCHIYNASIASGSFPNNFNKAKLTPVQKNNSIHERSNYRPISILPIISKPLERLNQTSFYTVNSQLIVLITLVKMHLLSLTDNWLRAMDSKELEGIVLLHLSKDFDLVDHSLLLSKLKKYCVANTCHQ